MCVEQPESTGCQLSSNPIAIAVHMDVRIQSNHLNELKKSATNLAARTRCQKLTYVTEFRHRIRRY
jgi:hypothetical protein